MSKRVKLLGEFTQLSQNLDQTKCRNIFKGLIESEKEEHSPVGPLWWLSQMKDQGFSATSEVYSAVIDLMGHSDWIEEEGCSKAMSLVKEMKANNLHVPEETYYAVSRAYCTFGDPEYIQQANQTLIGLGMKVESNVSSSIANHNLL